MQAVERGTSVVPRTARHLALSVFDVRPQQWRQPEER